MQNISENTLIQMGLRPLAKAEVLQINGGGWGEIIFDAALFLVSPAMGLFNLGLKEGYREAERANK